MGIRIHKFLGYGLDDVNYDKETWKFDDERINPDSFFINHETKTPSVDDYIEWLENNSIEKFSIEKMFLKEKQAKDPKKYRMDQACVHQAEYGISSVLMFRPLTAHEWSRWDDSIDYIMETELLESGKPEYRIEPLRGGIYPYNGNYMDKRSGVQLSQHVMTYIRSCNSQKSPSIETLNLLAKALGFEDHADAQTNISPCIPEPIVDLCRYSKIFTDDATILELKPMLYTYWS